MRVNHIAVLRRLIRHAVTGTAVCLGLFLSLVLWSTINVLLLDDRAASALLPTPAALTETFRQTVFGSTDWRGSSLRGVRGWGGELKMVIGGGGGGK